MTKRALSHLAICLALAACVGEEPTSPKADSKGNTPATPTSKPTTAKAEAMPRPAMPTARAPAQFSVEFHTTAGDFTVVAQRDWSPRGVDRFYEMVTKGFFKDIAFFRVLDGFMAQFGIHGNPKVGAIWKSARIDDDPVKQTNGRGMLSFATSGKNTRTTQMFINFGDNRRLDASGFSPFARVTKGMATVDKIYKIGERPKQGQIHAEGNAYLQRAFPNLTYIKSAVLIK